MARPASRPLPAAPAAPPRTLRARPPVPRAGLVACWRFGVPLALGGLVLLLYGEALGYAFMYDDGIDLARGEQRSVFSLLTSGEGAYYYRPLPFLLWKGLHAALGRYDLFWFHLPPLLLHALNGWLLYLLARALRLDRPVALLAAGLFVLTPFHYQTIPWAGALFHPLVTALMLGALLAYWRARRTGRHAWLVLSLVCAALALFTQEYAITLGVLVAGLEWLLWRQRQVAAPRPYALLYLALAAAFVAWWLAVPKWPRTTPLDPLARARNALLFLQAALWPLAFGWRAAPPTLLPHASAVVAVAGVGALAVAAWLFRRARAATWLVVAAAWVAVTALPVAATLPWEYLLDGPRLYYLPSVGIALGWAALALCLPPAGPRRTAALAALVALYGWAVWQSLGFLAERRDIYAEGSAALHEAAILARAAPPDAPLVFVNLPAWRAPVTAAFPLGTTGVTYLPEYVLLAQALHVNCARATPAASFTSPALLPDGWPTHYGPHGPAITLDELARQAEAGATVYAARFHPLRWERWTPAPRTE